MEEDKKINVSKVIITVISALILLLIIAILTKVLTNKKQAAEYDVGQAQTTMASSENVWAIKKEENTIAQNQATNQVENTSIQNNENLNENNNVVENTSNINQENNNINNTASVIENIVNDNKIEENNTQNQNTIEQNTISQNTSTENTTKDTNQTNTQNTTSDAKTTKDDKKSNNGVIWLTFDDGPSAITTPKVLDVLKKENVKATFFVLNYTDANEKIIKRIVDEGHTIGIHGYSHEYSKIYKSDDAFMNNIYTLQDKIYKSTGVKTMYMRFPGGSSNTVSRKYSKGIMTRLTKKVLAKGFKYYDWNISSGDAGGAKDSKAVYRNVTKNLSKKRGNLVLCHDIHQKTLDALPDIIKFAKKNGYTFAPIDDNTPMYAQHVNN